MLRIRKCLPFLFIITCFLTWHISNFKAYAFDLFYREIDFICETFNSRFESSDVSDYFLPYYIDREFLRSVDHKVHPQVTDLIFVGDSRVVGMAGIGGYHYVGLNGSGYSWFSTEGCHYMYEQMAQYPDADVILCFGVNDVNNIGAYISFYNSLIASYPSTRFWVMSVNPCDDEPAAAAGFFVRNSMIDEFNAIMMEAFPDYYLDINSYLWKFGYGTMDGVHYDYGTYLVIQEYSKYLIQQKLNMR